MSDIDGFILSFKNNIISDHQQLDPRNIFICLFLYLRVPSFVEINCSLIHKLKFIDIAFTNIKDAYFTVRIIL